MTGDLQKGTWKRLACSASKRRVVLAMLLLVVNGADEPACHVTFGASLDKGVALLRTMTELLLHVLNSPFEAFQTSLASLPM